MSVQIHAIFDQPGDAERAGGALLDYGVKAEYLTIIQPYVEERSATTYQAVDAATKSPTPADAPNSVYEEVPYEGLDVEEDGTETDYEAKHSISVTTAGDAGIGAVKGAGWGFGLGTVAALTALFIPGVGLVIGSGALAIALAGAVATTGAGAVAGAVTGYLKDQGFEDTETQRFVDVVSNGGAVLSVLLPAGGLEPAVAWEIIEKYGGTPLVNVEVVRTPYLA